MVDIGMGLALQRHRHTMPLRPQDRYDEAVALLRAVHYGFEIRILGGFEIGGFKTKKMTYPDSLELSYCSALLVYALVIF